ncbi:hypothetical protein BpHYR1_008941 [Brachionus plicatilis]|uniref:Uncharacterized protein n=1 Tax=Brachionus plicatilis TaxID=10195 RepID=A0A3M7QJS0_BRAPC|nr:hypothetical protein BpHYR1_008941 [Brachionus plicatilis]
MKHILTLKDLKEYNKLIQILKSFFKNESFYFATLRQKKHFLQNIKNNTRFKLWLALIYFLRFRKCKTFEPKLDVRPHVEAIKKFSNFSTFRICIICSDMDSLKPNTKK